MRPTKRRNTPQLTLNFASPVQNVLKALCLLFAVAVFHSLSFANNNLHHEDPDVVAQVDLNRYMGFWYEVAHSPNFFQRDCVRSTAEYALLSNASVSVHNTCYKADGSVSDITGVGKVVDPAVPAKIEVRFSPFSSGDYWIVSLDPDYKWSVVSGPGKKSLFILSREVPMTSQTLDQIIMDLKARGFNTDTLIYDELPAP